jgi:hypothetical protein
VSVTKADKDHDSGSMVGVAAFAFGRSPSVALAAARPRLSADPLWRHGAAEVLIVGVVGSIEEERQSGLKVEDLVTGVEDDAAGPGRCMMLIAPLTVWVPPTKSICEV